MNQKTALKILGLKPGASLAQAKKAFRDLAKQYHPDLHPPDLHPPDLSPRGEIGDVRAEARMDRMKQINQAFHFLAPLLTSTPGSPGKASTNTPPFSREEKTKTDPWFPAILRMLKKGLKLKTGRKSGNCRPRPSVKQPLKSKVRRNNRAGKPARFSTILHTLHPGAAVEKKNRVNGWNYRVRHRDSIGYPRASRSHPYGNFIKYMALKKKIDAGTRSEQNIGRIEKIRPVARVNPIGDKTKS